MKKLFFKKNLVSIDRFSVYHVETFVAYKNAWFRVASFEDERFAISSLRFYSEHEFGVHYPQPVRIVVESSVRKVYEF